MRVHKYICLAAMKAPHVMYSNRSIFKSRPVSSSQLRTGSLTGLNLAFKCAVLMAFIGAAATSPAWAAPVGEKAISTAFVVNLPLTGGVPTVQVEFESAMDLSTVIPANFFVSDRTNASLPLGTLTIHPDMVAGKTGPDPSRPGLDFSPNTYWLTWNSGEMLQGQLGKVIVNSMKELSGTPVPDGTLYWVTGKGIAPTANSLVLNTPSNPTGATLVPLTVVFSEPVQNFDISDLVFSPSTGVSYNGPFITGGPTTYSIEFRSVTVSGNGTGTISCAFASSPAIQDLAGNPLVTPVTLPTVVVQLDRVQPYVVSVTCPSPTNNPQFTITFNKDVLAFNDPATDLTITKGVSSTLDWTGVTLTGGPRVYTVGFQGIVGSGALSLKVNASDIHDSALSALSSTGSQVTVTVDTVQPRAVAISPTNGNGPTSATSIGFTVQFDKPVYGFVPADLAVSGAGVNYTGAQIYGNDGDTTWSVQVTGVSGDGTMVLRVKTGDQGGVAHDQAGNKLYSSVSSSGVIIDNTGPRVTDITSQSGNYVQGGAVPFTVTFNEAVKQFDAANDLVITTTGSVSYAGIAIQGGPQTWTVFVAGMSGEGTITLAVNIHSNVCDLSNNQILSSVTSAPVNVDITRPRATAITPVTANPTHSTSVSFSVHFSESVKNFTDATDLVIAETQTVGHTGATISGGPQDYTVSLTGVHGTGTISLAANTVADIKDQAGNQLDSSVFSVPLTVDNTLPTVTVNSLVTKSQTPTLGGSAGDNFGVASVSVTVNGTTHAASFDIGSGTWSIAWPDTLPQGVYDVAATVTDTAGNTAGDSTSGELTVDLTPPTVTVTSQLTGDRTPFISGTVSDNVGVSSVTFTVNGVTYNATLSGGAWNGQVTNQLPAVDQQYDVVVTATDTAGNVGHDATTNELTFSTSVPTVYVNNLFTSNTSPTITGSVVFTPPATGVSSVSVVVHGQTYSAVLAPPSGSTVAWTAHVTEVLPEGIYDVAAHTVDNVTRPGTDGSTNELTVDTHGPAATFSLLEGSPTNEDVLHVTVTFNEALASPLDGSGVTLTGTLKDAVSFDVSGAAPAYTVTITMNDPNADGTLGVQINPTVTDRALNAYAGAASPDWSVSNWMGFTVHPQTAGAYDGSPHSFHVEASFGTSTPVYAWKWNDGAKSILDVGTDSPDLVIPDVTGKAGSYWCDVTYDGVIYSSNKATLFVAARPSIAQEPQDETRMVGERCDFSVVAEGGFPPLAYEWWKDGARISNATGNSLSIAKVEHKDAGSYQVIVSDVLGTSASSTLATLVVSGQPVPVAGLGGLAVLAGLCALMGCRPGSGRKK